MNFDMSTLKIDEVLTDMNRYSKRLQLADDIKNST